MVDKIYKHKKYYDKFINFDKHIQNRIFNLERQLIKNYPDFDAASIKAIKYKGKKVLRKHVSRNPDLIILFDIFQISNVKCLILWNLIKHDQYQKALKELYYLINPIFDNNIIVPIDSDEFIEEEINPDIENIQNIDEEILKFYFGKWYYTFDLVPIDILSDELYFNKINFSLEPLLTSQQMEALNSPSPLMLQGTSGTGKTLILLERLKYFYKDLSEEEKKIKKIGYLTLFPKVAESIKNYFSLRMAEIVNFEFTGVYQLFKQIIEDNGIDINRFYSKENRVDYNRFYKEWYNIRRHNFRIEPEILWQEIRGKILGKSSKEVLSINEYQQYLNEKIAENYFDERTVNTIYNASRNYIEWKRRENLWDDCDLAWNCLNIVNEENIKKFDALAVDEVQDLTEREITILVKICKDLNVSFAGDINQKLYPSSFLWTYVVEAIKNIIPNYLSKPLILNINFRSKRNIVEFGNFFIRKMREIERINDLRVNAIEQSSYDFSSVNKITFVKYSNHDLLLGKIKSINSSPDLVYICPIMEYKISDIDFFFSVEEFKGLESKKVILVNFFKWLKDTQNYNNFFKNMHALQRFYVAVTRAIEELFIFDEEDIFYELNDYIERHDDININLLLDNAKALRWEEQGIYYENNEKIYEALICYEKAAGLYESSENNFQKAAILYETKLNKFEKARDCYYNASLWNDCIRVCEKIDDYKTIGDIYENYLDKLEDAKECYHKAESWADYARVCEKLNLFNEAANVYENKLNQYDKARGCYYKVKLWADCIRVCEKIDDYKTIGDIYENYLDKLEDAKECYHKAESWEDYARVCEKLNLLNEAANVYENKLNQYEKAKECYFSAESWVDYARVCEKLNLLNEAANVYENKLNQYEKAKECYFFAESWADYARVCEKLNLLNEAANVYENKLNQYEKAKECYFFAESWADYARVCEILQDYLEAAVIYEHKLHNKEKAKEFYFQSNSWEDYARVCISLGLFKEAANVYENNLNQYDKARNCYYKARLLDDCIRVCEKINDYKTIGYIYENHKKVLETAKDFYYKAESWKDYVRVCEALGLLKEAAEVYEYKIQNYVKAKKYYEELKLWDDLIRICEKTHDYYNLARINEYLKKDYEKAKKYYLDSFSYEDAARICLILNQKYEAAQIFEFNLKDYENSKKIYAELASWKDYARVCERNKDYIEAASIYEEKLGELEKALILFTKVHSYKDMARIYLKLKQYEDAIKLYETNLNNPLMVAKIYENEIKDYKKAYKYYYKIKKYTDLIRVIYKMVLKKFFNK